MENTSVSSVTKFKKQLLMLFAVPGESKDVVYEWGSVLVCKNMDIVRQSIYKSSPALFSIVDNVEACVSVVQLQPLYTFWQLKSLWKHTQTHAHTPKNLPFDPRLWDLMLQVNTLCFTWLGLQSEHLSALRGQTTAVVYVRHWNIPQAKKSAKYS